MGRARAMYIQNRQLNQSVTMDVPRLHIIFRGPSVYGEGHQGLETILSRLHIGLDAAGFKRNPQYDVCTLQMSYWDISK
jgi:hypothetical protein